MKNLLSFLVFIFSISFHLFSEEIDHEYADDDIYQLCKKASSQESNDQYAPMANLEGEPSAYVHGCVNVITGQFCEFHTDLVLHHGIDPVKIERSFAGNTTNAGGIGSGWQINHRSYMVFKNFLGKYYDIIVQRMQRCFFIDDHGGMPMIFEEGKYNANLSLRPELFYHGITNVSQGVISGQTNLRNLKLYPTGDGNSVIISGNRTTREYFLPSKKYRIYCLKSDEKPTGNKYTYDYSSKNALKRIELQNQKNVCVGHIDFAKHSKKRMYKERPFKVQTNDGRSVSYNFEKINKRMAVLKSVESSDHPKIEYEYSFKERDGYDFNLIQKKCLPENRILEIDYYGDGDNLVLGQNINFNNQLHDARMHRVKSLWAPTGTDNTRSPIYHFIYDLFIERDVGRRRVKHGSCNVYNALGYRTQYGFNENHRLTSVNKFLANGLPYAIERLFWADNSSKNTTALITRDLIDHTGTIFARNYEYDEAGNVLIDSLFGNLTGHNFASPIILADGKVIENGSDCFRKHQEYTKDDYNLLTREYDGILTTEYHYKPYSNLLSVKFQGSPEKWERRFFYFYNEDAALVKEISDDGSQTNCNDLSDVTERKIIYYTQSKVYPAAYPLEIEEKCLDLETGEEKLVHKVINTYTNRANISKQDHYDSLGNFAYSLSWDYDNLGNITKEVNALGQATIRRYDANGNCVFEQSDSSYSLKYFTYDYMNRLIKEDEIYPDLQHRVISHKYDAVSNRIATVDANGNEVQFKYDPFGRLIETIYPPVLNENKVLCNPITKKEYDVMSKVTKEVNALGVETLMRYTIRGQLAEVVYPDGTTERNTYCLNGLLRESKAKNNTVTKYSYDILSRPIQIEVYDANRELLSTSSTVYRGSHILYEIDPAGITTSYTYYSDGKIKTKQKGYHLVSFAYDALGREYKTIDHYGPNDTDIIVKIKEHDLLNRVTSEKIEDGNGIVLSKVDYSYDIQGNISQTTNYNQSGCNVTKTHYDCHNELYSITDAEGNQVNFRINYNYRNQLGQIAPYKEIIDSKGNVTVSIGDALNRTVLTLKKNAFGKVIQKQEFLYDLKGNQRAITDTVITDGELDQEITCMMHYDSSNRLTACYEAYGTPEQKLTKITYNCFGQKEYLLKNDGISLLHTYDSLGRLKSLQSSDSTVHYTYEYDLHNNPLKVEDKIQGIVTTRKYNQNGLLIHEELGNQLCLEYQHDRMGRTNLISLSDDSKITHHYHATQLKSISRLDSLNHTVYTHQYETYDLSGNVEQSILVGNAGTLNYEYDILGRIKSSKIDTNQWKEQIKSYDSVGNILEIAQKDNLGKFSSSYTYDDLYQITSETGTSPHSYSYDSHYNRRTKDGRRHHLNLLHQLIDDGLNTYTYDRNGNMKSKKSTEHTSTFAYDALDRLTSYIQDDQKVVYQYDENNRRLSKTFYTSTGNNQWRKQNTIRYLYQGQNEIGAVDKNDQFMELRILGLGKGAEIGAAVAMEINHKLYIPIHDHIGNVSCLLNGTTGEIAETYRYSTFGEELFDGLTAISPWRFSSKRNDNESGLTYFGRRYYDAVIGRWATPDPIGREGGPNLYAYVLNASLTHFDLYGLFGMDSICSGFECLFDSISSCFGRLISFASQGMGHAISCFSRELLPLPYVQELVDFSGWCLRGENPANYDWKQFQSKFLVYEGSKQLNPRHVHVVNNGIATSELDFTERMANYSKLYGDITVYGLYTGCRGALYDILETGCQKLGIPTYGQQLANKSMSWLNGQQGEYKDETTFFMESHSRANETTYHLDKEYRNHMELTGFAPARIGSNGHYRSANYYVCPCDGVPLLSPIEYFKGKKNGHVHFLPSNSNPLTDHFYDNNQFQKIRERLGKDYQKTYGKAA